MPMQARLLLIIYAAASLTYSLRLKRLLFVDVVSLALFYVLRVLDSDMRILVPVEKAEQVGLREVVQEDQIREVYDILKEKELHIDKQTWNRRYRSFRAKIQTGSIYDVAEVLRDLYRLKTDKQLSFGERTMLDMARTLIVKEIAISRGQTEENVRGEIEAIFQVN